MPARATVFTDTTEALMKAGDLLGAIEEAPGPKTNWPPPWSNCAAASTRRRSAEEITSSNPWATRWKTWPLLRWRMTAG